MHGCGTAAVACNLVAGVHHNNSFLNLRQKAYPLALHMLQGIKFENLEPLQAHCRPAHLM